MPPITCTLRIVYDRVSMFAAWFTYMTHYLQNPYCAILINLTLKPIKQYELIPSGLPVIKTFHQDHIDQCSRGEFVSPK